MSSSGTEHGRLTHVTVRCRFNYKYPSTVPQSQNIPSRSMLVRRDYGNVRFGISARSAQRCRRCNFREQPITTVNGWRCTSDDGVCSSGHACFLPSISEMVSSDRNHPRDALRQFLSSDSSETVFCLREPYFRAGYHQLHRTDLCHDAAIP